MSERFFVETLGCPKNAVDSDKVTATLLADGLVAVDAPEDADLVVVNTCAFIEAARQESIDTVLALSDRRRSGARLVVTGCMAERYGDELAAALPEVDAVVACWVPPWCQLAYCFSPVHSPHPASPCGALPLLAGSVLVSPTRHWPSTEVNSSPLAPAAWPAASS